MEKTDLALRDGLFFSFGWKSIRILQVLQYQEIDTFLTGLQGHVCLCSRCMSKVLEGQSGTKFPSYLLDCLQLLD